MPRNQRDLVLTDVERRIAVSEIVGFETLGADALAAIASLSRRRQLAPGEHLIRPGAQRARTQLVLSGDLQLRRAGQLWPHPEERRPLDIFWAARDTQPLEIWSRDGAELLEFSFQGLDEVLEEHFATWVSIARRLASALLTMNDRAHQRMRPRARPAGLSGRLSALQDALPYARRHVDALVQLAEEGREVHFDTGAVMVEAGTPSHRLLVPLDVALDGWQVPCSPCGVEMLAHIPHADTVRATMPMTALEITEESLLDLMEDHHDLARELVATLATAVINRIEESLRGENGTGKD